MVLSNWNFLKIWPKNGSDWKPELGKWKGTQHIPGWSFTIECSLE